MIQCWNIKTVTFPDYFRLQAEDSEWTVPQSPLLSICFCLRAAQTLILLGIKDRICDSGKNICYLSSTVFPFMPLMQRVNWLDLFKARSKPLCLFPIYRARTTRSNSRNLIFFFKCMELSDHTFNAVSQKSVLNYMGTKPYATLTSGECSKVSN